MSSLYTWRDVERLIGRVANPPWVTVSIDVSTIVITCAPNDRERVAEKLSSIFGHQLTRDELRLESTIDNPRIMRIEWEEPEEIDAQIPQKVVRPLWRDARALNPPLPTIALNSPRLLAFYSYKGGVGRTTALLAVMRALLSDTKGSSTRPASILVVDGDIEAPGLTWNIPGQDRFCLFDLLALVHDSNDWEKSALPIAAERLQRTKETVELSTGLASFFFLPAYRTDDQLFAPPITFEQVVRARGRANVIPEMFAALGEKLGVDVVLFDLRAGVTEFSSPMLLDPRVQTILVTSCNRQSIEGTLLVLDRMTNRIQLETAPEVLLNMIPTTFTEEQIGEITSRLLDRLPTPSDDDPAGTVAQTNVHETTFAESLIHYESLGELLSLIPQTQLGKCAEEIARRFMPQSSGEIMKLSNASPARQGSMRAIEKHAERLEYAEGNGEQGLLSTPALNSLILQSVGGMPTAVVLGAKGAGKTYAWGQMVIIGEWAKFAQVIHDPKPAPANVLPARIFPLLGPSNAQPQLNEKRMQAEKSVWNALGISGNCMTADELESRLSRQSSSDDELAFWTDMTAARLGLPKECGRSVENLAEELARRNVSIVLAVDGLEDAFQPGPRNPLTPDQQRILRGLLIRFNKRLAEVHSPNLGLVTFVRRDLAEAAIPQNFGQFEKQYQRFALSWSPTEALRLVAWVLQGAGRQVMAPERIPFASEDELRTALESLWGERMGSEKSKEAYSDRWVIAALSDFQGRLQPRDVVRLLRYAAQEMADDATQLTPPALRTALAKCSSDKIREIQREIPKLEEIFNQFRDAHPDKKRIPFNAESFDLTPDVVSFLETHGIVFRNPQGDLFMPEIVRYGLDFKMDKGRRPPVLAMYRRATRVKRS